jgi:hypothetical protein
MISREETGKLYQLLEEITVAREILADRVLWEAHGDKDVFFRLELSAKDAAPFNFMMTVDMARYTLESYLEWKRTAADELLKRFRAEIDAGVAAPV